MNADRRSRRILGAVALTGVVLLLAACGGQRAGSAATLGDTRITESEVTAKVQELYAAQGKPVDSADELVPADMVGRMLIVELVDILAARNGVTASRGAIDEQIAAYELQAGGPEAMVNTFLQQGVAPSQIEDVIRLSVLAGALGPVLVPDGPPDVQSQAVFEAVVRLSDELGVEVSPRYGTWDPTTLQMGPTPDDLTRLPALEQ